MKKILVGLDGSQASLNALKYALKMAGLLRAEIVGITVINELSYSEYYKDISEKLKTEAEGMLQKVVAAVDKDGITIRTRIENGTPDVVFAELAKMDPEIAMVVVGASGRGRGSRVFVGSKTHALVNQAAAGLPCPVVVVPGNSEDLLKRV
jgi:nucleotide-binding universal stress UspA family protein